MGDDLISIKRITEVEMTVVSAKCDPGPQNQS